MLLKSVLSVGLIGAVLFGSNAIAAPADKTIDEAAFIASTITRDAEKAAMNAGLLEAEKLAKAIAKPAQAASPQATAAFDPSDIWYLESESGWGISMNYRPTSNQMFAVWYTYDPRRSAGTGISEPLWVVVPGGTFVTPTRFEADMYVTRGTFFGTPWVGATNTKVGSLVINFTSPDTAIFEARMSPPAASGQDPAAGLPAYIVTKNIARLKF